MKRSNGTRRSTTRPDLSIVLLASAIVSLVETDAARSASQPSEIEKDLAVCAERGDTSCQLALGTAYELGLGVEKDPRKAIHWVRRSAESGNPRAQLRLGLMYLEGLGTEIDKIQGLSWIQKARDQGDYEANMIHYHLVEEGDDEFLTGC